MTFTATTAEVPEHYGPVQITVPYPEMVARYGKPNSTDDDTKTDVAWDLADVPHWVHVYNYKNGPAYTGQGTIDEISAYSVQGTSKEAVDAFIAEATRKQ